MRRLAGYLGVKQCTGENDSSCKLVYVTERAGIDFAGRETVPVAASYWASVFLGGGGVGCGDWVGRGGGGGSPVKIHPWCDEYCYLPPAH